MGTFASVQHGSVSWDVTAKSMPSIKTDILVHLSESAFHVGSAPTGLVFAGKPVGKANGIGEHNLAARDSNENIAQQAEKQPEAEEKNAAAGASAPAAKPAGMSGKSGAAKRKGGAALSAMWSKAPPKRAAPTAKGTGNAVEGCEKAPAVDAEAALKLIEQVLPSAAIGVRPAQITCGGVLGLIAAYGTG
jgi:hypothetical protein